MRQSQRPLNHPGDCVRSSYCVHKRHSGFFPHVVVPLFVGRSRSICAIEAAVAEDERVIMLTQKSPHNDDPSFEDMCRVGVLGNILEMLGLADGTVKVLLEGVKGVPVEKYIDEKDCYSAEYEILETKEIKDPHEFEGYRRSITDQFENCAKMNRRISMRS